MCPEKIFLGLTLYDILICVGIIVCFFSFSYLADCARLKVKLQKYSLLVGVAAIAIGFGSAILFQAIYNIEERGGFELTLDTGATFYGGLVGGVCSFLLLYFGLSRLFFKGELRGYPQKSFFTVAGCAVPSIIVAHAFGRLGCLTAGCCHGKVTNAWLGIMMYGDMGYRRYVPVQLFEAIFLFALFALLFIRARDGKRFSLSIYAISYGVWRFVIEYARADYRGSIPILGLTPSQLTALLMILVALLVIPLEMRIRSHMEREAAKDGESDAAAENAPCEETLCEESPCADATAEKMLVDESADAGDVDAEGGSTDE